MKRIKKITVAALFNLALATSAFAGVMEDIGAATFDPVMLWLSIMF